MDTFRKALAWGAGLAGTALVFTMEHSPQEVQGNLALWLDYFGLSGLAAVTPPALDLAIILLGYGLIAAAVYFIFVSPVVAKREGRTDLENIYAEGQALIDQKDKDAQWLDNTAHWFHTSEQSVKTHAPTELFGYQTHTTLPAEKTHRTYVPALQSKLTKLRLIVQRAQI